MKKWNFFALCLCLGIGNFAYPVGVEVGDGNSRVVFDNGFNLQLNEEVKAEKLMHALKLSGKNKKFQGTTYIFKRDKSVSLKDLKIRELINNPQAKIVEYDSGEYYGFKVVTKKGARTKIYYVIQNHENDGLKFLGELKTENDKLILQEVINSIHKK